MATGDQLSKSSGPVAIDSDAETGPTRQASREASKKQQCPAFTPGMKGAIVRHFSLLHPARFLLLPAWNFPLSPKPPAGRMKPREAAPAMGH